MGSHKYWRQVSISPMRLGISLKLRNGKKFCIRFLTQKDRYAFIISLIWLNSNIVGFL